LIAVSQSSAGLSDASALLDALRVLFIVIVVVQDDLPHLVGHSYIGGGAAVKGFMVLSFYTWAHNYSTSTAWLDSATRLAAILPVYWLQLLMAGRSDALVWFCQGTWLSLDPAGAWFLQTLAMLILLFPVIACAVGVLPTTVTCKERCLLLVATQSLPSIWSWLCQLGGIPSMRAAWASYHSPVVYIPVVIYCLRTVTDVSTKRSFSWRSIMGNCALILAALLLPWNGGFLKISCLWNTPLGLKLGFYGSFPLAQVLMMLGLPGVHGVTLRNRLANILSALSPYTLEVYALSVTLLHTLELPVPLYLFFLISTSYSVHHLITVPVSLFFGKLLADRSCIPRGPVQSTKTLM